MWVCLNWALAFRELGYAVIWLEVVKSSTHPHKLRTRLEALKTRLEPYGLADSVALCSPAGGPAPADIGGGCLDLDGAAEADLLVNLRNSTSSDVVGRFRRSALLDIDPGLLQLWMDAGEVEVAPHDVYFTIGETVGQPGAPFPDMGLAWHHTPPCVCLSWWPARPAPLEAPFTTVAHWNSAAWLDPATPETKHDGFLPFLDLPRRVAYPLELALDLEDDDPECAGLRERGWRVRTARTVASTPWDYQRYIQNSRGEFSCAKPSCMRLQNAWVSDRTLCYLASGKPAIVQYTGPSRYLPDREGLFRFRDLEEAAAALDAVTADYDRQCRAARALAEEHFDARKVAARLLERALA